MCLFFLTDPATTMIFPLSLHDALPIWAVSIRLNSTAKHRYSGRAHANPCHSKRASDGPSERRNGPGSRTCERGCRYQPGRSEEHTSELQSLRHLVCRLLLEKKK